MFVNYVLATEMVSRATVCLYMDDENELMAFTTVRTRIV